VPQPHDLAPKSLGGDLQAIRQRLALDDEGVVPHRLEGIGQPGEDAAAVVLNLRGLPMHGPHCAHHIATEYLADGLVAQADS